MTPCGDEVVGGDGCKIGKTQDPVKLSSGQTLSKVEAFPGRMWPFLRPSTRSTSGPKVLRLNGGVAVS